MLKIKYLEIFFQDRALLNSFLVLQMIFIVSSLFELAGISMLGPLLFIFTNGVESLNNTYVDRLYSFLNPSSFSQFASYFTILTMCIIFLGGVISFISIILLSRFATYAGVFLGNKVFAHYLQKDWAFFLEIKKSKMVNEIYAESSRVTQNVLVPLLMINKAIFLSAVIFCLLLYIDWKLTLAFFFVLSSLYLLIYLLFRKKLNVNSRILTDTHEDRFKFLDDTFSSIKEIHIWNNSSIFLDGFNIASRKWAGALRNNMNIASIPRYLVETFVLLLICIIFFVIFSKSSTDIIQTLPSYSVFIFSSLKLLPALQQLYYGSSQVTGNSFALENLFHVLKSTEYSSSKDIEISSQVESIQIKSLFFKYPNSEFAINDLNLEMHNNSLIGITGFSGAGKSTLVDLLMGLLKPTDGSILINNKAIEIYENRSWFKKIAYLPPKTNIINDSLAGNIHFSQEPNIDFKRMQAVQLQSNINEFTEKITQENADKLFIGNLSGGQLQRVGIARTLYKDTEVIFFDEPTSALDNLNKAHFLNGIERIKLNKIIFVVSHDTQLLEHTDQLIVLDNGEVEFSGDFKDALERSHIMKQLITKNEQQ